MSILNSSRTKHEKQTQLQPRDAAWVGQDQSTVVQVTAFLNCKEPCFWNAGLATVFWMVGTPMSTVDSVR